MNTCPQLKAYEDAKKFARRLHARGFRNWGPAYRYAFNFAYEMITRQDMTPAEILHRDWYFNVIRAGRERFQFNLSAAPGIVFTP